MVHWSSVVQNIKPEEHMVRVTTADGRWQGFCDRIRGFLEADVTEQDIDGVRVRGYRSPDNPALWIRDHSDIVRGGKYFHADLTSSVDCFAANQAANGRIFDYVLTSPLAHSNERENWEKWIRIPVEADVEYRFVKAAHQAWQATGDTEWLRRLLPSLERAVDYLVSSPIRWDETHGLVKRAYTIDTWDFDYTAGREPWLNFQITPDTFWGIFHGDNSGLYEAASTVAAMHALAGDAESAGRLRELADGVRLRANALLFNGRFYTHFHKLSPVTIEGVNESEQLSLSNPMAINRGLATDEIARAVIAEYRRRRETGASFAEWYIIDPPFPDGTFGDEKLVAGAYVNGGIFPLCGGELARAALNHGAESYGIEILDQYASMIESSGAAYLWYFPDGTPSSPETSTSPDATPTDGWGSSAMLYGLVEGLAGVVDRHCCFSQVELTPRWLFAGEQEADVEISYAASGARFGYRYRHDESRRRILLEVSGDARSVTIRLPLPHGATLERTTWNGTESPVRVRAPAGADRTPHYLEIAPVKPGTGVLEIAYRG